jgi:hypothetical protein
MSWLHFAATHREDTFQFRNSDVPGGEFARIIRSELIERLTGEAAPYNSIFTTNGIASTTASIIAASLGYIDITSPDAWSGREDQAGPPAAGHGGPSPTRSC